MTEAQQMEAKLAELQNLREMARSVQGYQTRAEMLERPVSALKGHVEILKEFHRRGIVVEIEQAAAIARSMAPRLRQVGSGFEGNPESILTSDESLRRGFWDVLSGGTLSTAVKEALSKAWGRHVDSLLPAMNRDLLDSLSRIPALQEQANRVRQLLSRVQESRERLPQMATDFSRLNATVQALEESWRALGAETPSEVLSFLQAAVAGGARLDHMTSTVEEWLERHDLKQDLRVVFKSQAQGVGRR